MLTIIYNIDKLIKEITVMGFFIAMGLIVLPLFLFVCVKILNQSDFGKTLIGKILKLIFYLFAIAAIATGVYLITKI
jgi:hypothetical protein